MVYQTRYLHVPAQGGGAAPPIRFTILVVDLAAIICVYVSLGLYHRWVPSADNFSVFYAGPSGNDWENPVVHSVLVVSFFWTNFIYSRTALNHWIYLCSEFFITAALLGCTIPAFILSPLQGAHGIDRYCSYVFEGRFSVYETSGTCSEKYTALQRLQTAAFSLTFVVA